MNMKKNSQYDGGNQALKQPARHESMFAAGGLAGWVDVRLRAIMSLSLTD